MGSSKGALLTLEIASRGRQKLRSAEEEVVRATRHASNGRPLSAVGVLALSTHASCHLWGKDTVSPGNSSLFALSSPTPPFTISPHLKVDTKQRQPPSSTPTIDKLQSDKPSSPPSLLIPHPSSLIPHPSFPIPNARAQPNNPTPNQPHPTPLKSDQSPMQNPNPSTPPSPKKIPPIHPPTNQPTEALSSRK